MEMLWSIDGVMMEKHKSYKGRSTFLINVSSTKTNRVLLCFQTLIMTLIKTLIWTKIDESLSRKAN